MLNKKQIRILLAKCPKCGRQIFLMLASLILIACLILIGKVLTQTITDTRLVINLREQVATQVVDMELWQEINKQADWKKQPVAQEEKLIRNPFE